MAESRSAISETIRNANMLLTDGSIQRICISDSHETQGPPHTTQVQTSPSRKLLQPPTPVPLRLITRTVAENFGREATRFMTVCGTRLPNGDGRRVVAIGGKPEKICSF